MDDCFISTFTDNDDDDDDDFMQHLDNHSRDFGAEITDSFYKGTFDHVWRRPQKPHSKQLFKKKKNNSEGGNDE